MIKTIQINLNNYQGCVYQYMDDKSSVYLSNLKVDLEYQRKGLGIRLLRILEILGRSLGATYSYLWVEKQSWMHKWYKRQGYTNFKQHNDINFIWMKKKL